MRIKEAKEIDLVDYLAHLQYQPQKIVGHNYWYLSPLHDEQTASFKINRKLNRWRDYGLVNSIDRGNLVDFGITYFNCSVADFLAKLDNGLVLHRDILPAIKTKDHQIAIVAERPLTSHVLLDYLQRRGISAALAKAWCKEVHYQLKGGTYYAIGFKNNSGGYELRNERFQQSSSPKDYTTIGPATNSTVHVFEGFTDFLSYLSLPNFRALEPASYVILNTVKFFEKARPHLEQFQNIRLYLDHDETGRKCTQYALSQSNRYKDESQFYTGHKDLNDYLVKRKQNQKQQLKPRIS
ncbi:toprim domain-containing protein [Mucilaginibacter ximonensis]|uniref:Toprim domain-containing protein n=1 Tax=Mucilaginibacter ximonensis TaxID=538021 RepID=A0ABW5Y9D3_9SPHI